MRKFLNITVFVLILAFLLYLVPPINQYLRTDVLDTSFTFTFTPTPPAFVDPPPDFPTDERYVRIYTGQIVAYSSLNSVPAHLPYCDYQHLHIPGGFGYDIYGNIFEDPDPGGCGLGADPGFVTTSSAPSTDPSTESDPATSNDSSSTTTSSTEPPASCPPPETVYITETPECPPPEIITVTQTASCPPPEEIQCPEPEPVKQFDYGAFASRDPRWNLPWNTTDAPHFVSHSQFASAKIGATVDTPDYVTDDSSASDQDGLNLTLSNKNKIVLTQISNVRGNYGTIIVGRWEKKSEFYEFKVLAAERTTQAPASMFQADGVHISFEPDPLTGTIPDMKEGWLTVIYIDAEGNVDPNVPGSGQTAINGMPNYGFTLEQITGNGSNIPMWDGRNSTLDQIIYHQILQPFDASRAPGEVEDYLYCDKGPTGFRYYRPNDPQYLVDCGVPEVPVPEIILNTPTTTDYPPINVICNFNNVQNFVCDQDSGSGSGTIVDTGIVTPTDDRPITTILEELLTNYQTGQENTAETRLELIHDYLYTLLPQL